MSEIEIRDVTKRFGDVVALDDVSLRVADGELLVLVGPSGCGKTTLLRLIAGLEEPDTGTVAIGGSPVTDRPARKRDVGFVFQDYALFPHMDVRENLSFNLRMRGEVDDIDRRTTEVAELLDIETLLERDLDELSGGQKQRVALGRAIVGDPGAFLLDEPFANLDASLRDRMQTEIARLQRRLGTTTVHVTHNQREAMAMGDRIAVMENGSLQQVGHPEAVYREPATLFVARFIGSPAMNCFDGIAAGDGGIEVPGQGTTAWHLPVEPVERPSGPVVAGIRPEDIEVDPDGEPGENGLVGTVSFVEFNGADRFVYVDPEDHQEIVARVQSGGRLRADQRVRIGFDVADVHLFDAASGSRIPTRATPPGSADSTEEGSSTRTG